MNLRSAATPPDIQPSREDEPCPTSFARRLRNAVLLLGVAATAHVWLVRGPDIAPPAVTSATSGLASGLALAVSPRSAPVRSTASGAAPGWIAPRGSDATPGAPATLSGESPAVRTDGEERRRSRVEASHITTAVGRVGLAGRQSLRDDSPVAAVATTGGSEVATTGGSEIVLTSATDAGSQAPWQRAEHRIPALPQQRPVQSGVSPHVLGIVESMSGSWRSPIWSVDREAPETPRTAARTATVAVGAPAQEAIVLQVLQRYAQAHERLDVQALKAVRPDIDARALTRAFKQLEGQQLSLTNCGVSITGQAANARCQGDATFHPKVGPRPMHAAGEWTFRLARGDDGWHIADLDIQ